MSELEGADSASKSNDVTHVEDVAEAEIGFEHLEEVADVEDWQDEEQEEEEEEAGQQQEEDDEGDGEIIATEGIAPDEPVSSEATMVIVEAEASDAGVSAVDPREIECPVCKVILGSKLALGAHMRKAHQQGDPSRRNHICSFCNKAFTTSSNLQQHKRLHFNERPFQCNRCNKGFATSTNLKQHYRTHTGDRPFPCNYCPKRFATNSNLRQHIRTHTADIIADSTIQASVKSNPDGSETWEVEEGNVNLSLIPPICLQQYICNDCNKVYSNSSNLAQHRRTIHPKDFVRRYLCEYCEKTFSLVTNLRRHQKKTCPNAKRSETGSEATRQTWPCEDCGKICSTKGNLKSHKFTHLGIKMYECFICEKKFTTNSNLKQHLIVHDGKYNGLQPKRKKITLQIRDEKLNDSNEPDPSETTAAVRTLQVVSDGSAPLKEDYIAVSETPVLPKGRTQRPLIVKVDIDRDVKPRRSSISTKPILLPPPPLRLS